MALGPAPTRWPCTLIAHGAKSAIKDRHGKNMLSYARSGCEQRLGKEVVPNGKTAEGKYCMMVWGLQEVGGPQRTAAADAIFQRIREQGAVRFADNAPPQSPIFEAEITSPGVIRVTPDPAYSF